MKIYFITPKLDFVNSGGSVEEFDLMIRTLIELGNEVTVVTLFSRANNIPEPLPYPLIQENATAQGLFGTQAAIFKILRKYESRADIFQLDGHFFLYGAGLYRRLGGKVPVSAFFNRELNSWPEYVSPFFPARKDTILKKIKRTVRYFLEKYPGMRIANSMDFFSFTCPMIRDMYERFGLRKDEKSFVLGDPMDYKKIMAENGLSEDSYVKRNKHEGPFIIFYSSRMAPAKGFDVLLEGFSRVKNKNNFYLILGGCGPEEKYVRQKIKDLKLEPYVELPGWVPKNELYELHKKADIYIQADWIPYITAMSVQSALIFGLPCIVPGGIGLEWVAGPAALNFEYRNPDDLALKIEQLAADRELRAKLSQNCYIRLAEDEMNHEYQIRRLDRAMKDILAKIAEEIEEIV